MLPQGRSAGNSTPVSTEGDCRAGQLCHRAYAESDQEAMIVILCIMLWLRDMSLSSADAQHLGSYMHYLIIAVTFWID